jgi:TPR repeat protein
VMGRRAGAGPIEDGRAVYDRHDEATALRDWPLADHGTSRRDNKLGNMRGTAQGRRGLRRGREVVPVSRRAHSNLGDAYAKGQGVSKDYAEAVKGSPKWPIGLRSCAGPPFR